MWNLGKGRTPVFVPYCLHRPLAYRGCHRTQNPRGLGSCGFESLPDGIQQARKTIGLEVLSADRSVESCVPIVCQLDKSQPNGVELGPTLHPRKCLLCSTQR